MSVISITLSDERLEQLHQLAVRFNISPEDLVRVGIEDFLSRPDEAFQQAVEHVLSKNQQLYKRLA